MRLSCHCTDRGNDGRARYAADVFCRVVFLDLPAIRETNDQHKYAVIGCLYRPDAIYQISWRSCCAVHRVVKPKTSQETAAVHCYSRCASAVLPPHLLAARKRLP